MDNKIKRPVDITVLAILATIGGICLIAASILMLLKIIEPSGWELAYLIFAIFPFLIAYGFFTAKNWARIIFVLFLLVAAASYIWQNIDQLTLAIIPIISIFVVIYVLTRSHVKAYFKNI